MLTVLFLGHRRCYLVSGMSYCSFFSCSDGKSTQHTGTVADNRLASTASPLLQRFCHHSLLRPLLPYWDIEVCYLSKPWHIAVREVGEELREGLPINSAVERTSAMDTLRVTLVLNSLLYMIFPLYVSGAHLSNLVF